ncbi:MAG: type II toxin-antitoxin system HicA family toxin [Megasphaera sp.]|uniref:type II toxin-antitoxin system HicA family toxin n=2 Tax=Megasphaera TaxID=906 RepID=UPI003A7FA9BD
MTFAVDGQRYFVALIRSFFHKNRLFKEMKIHSKDCLHIYEYTQKVYDIIKKGVYRMKRSELLKILKKNGCKLIGHGGNHDLYYSPITGKQFPVWRHNKDIPPGTIKAIFKQAGIQ